MEYYSTRNKSLRVPLQEAIVRGLAADGGLFMPERVIPLPVSWFANPPVTLQDIGFDVARQLTNNDLPAKDLRSIVDEALNFDIRLVQLEPFTWAMELFHGPTLAFKDFGARFLAGLLEYFAGKQEKEIVVLAATSGDTGSAVASGFFNKSGIRVIILYPSGKVSPLQEKQLTTLGGNISAWEVDGTFDDCQRLVKQIFLDVELSDKFLLTSANSINLGRLLPQTFYYFYAWAKIAKGSSILFSVPSGNFGNLTAGVIAKRLGLPVYKFVAATNVNDIVPSFLSNGKYLARPSRSTISNAMDVGDPSNFSRLMDLYGSDYRAMAGDVAGFSFSDLQTRNAILNVLRDHSYQLDPHGAVGYLGLQAFRNDSNKNIHGVFLETAHPGKFFEVVESCIGHEIQLPVELVALRDRQKRSIKVSADFDDVRQLLLRS